MAVNPQQKKPGPENTLGQTLVSKMVLTRHRGVFAIASEVLLQLFGPAFCSCLVLSSLELSLEVPWQLTWWRSLR